MACRVRCLLCFTELFANFFCSHVSPAVTTPWGYGCMKFLDGCETASRVPKVFIFIRLFITARVVYLFIYFGKCLFTELEYSVERET